MRRQAQHLARVLKHIFPNLPFRGGKQQEVLPQMMQKTARGLAELLLLKHSCIDWYVSTIASFAMAIDICCLLSILRIHQPLVLSFYAMSPLGTSSSVQFYPISPEMSMIKYQILQVDR